MLHAEPSESVLLALILCILCMYFLKWKLHSIRVPHYLIQNSYTMLSSKLRILIRTNLVLTHYTMSRSHACTADICTCTLVIQALYILRFTRYALHTTF